MKLKGIFKFSIAAMETNKMHKLGEIFCCYLTDT